MAVRRRARFVVAEFGADVMQGLGGVLEASMRRRITSAINVHDQPARPLQGANRAEFSRGENGKLTFSRRVYGYRQAKVRKGAKPVRDWLLSGATMRAMGVIKATSGRVTIGFRGELANKIAAINNRRERQFGASPKDRAAVVQAVYALFGARARRAA